MPKLIEGIRPHNRESLALLCPPGKLELFNGRNDFIRFSIDAESKLPTIFYQGQRAFEVKRNRWVKLTQCVERSPRVKGLAVFSCQTFDEPFGRKVGIQYM